ncbi:unnamed protein product, partial [Heterosigma akashiwo]
EGCLPTGGSPRQPRLGSSSRTRDLGGEEESFSAKQSLQWQPLGSTPDREEKRENESSSSYCD